MARQRTWLEWLNPMTRVQRWFTFGSFVWLASATVLLVLAFVREGVSLPAWFAIYLLSTVVSSAVAFVLYGVDKRRAIKERPRVSERTLHVLGLLGGWPGAYLASRLFRHKTLKISFRVLFWLTVVMHLVIIGYGILSGWLLVAIRALVGA